MVHVAANHHAPASLAQLAKLMAAGNFKIHHALEAATCGVGAQK
jgi:hypothetical protein